jgi:hypothetical protein
MTNKRKEVTPTEIDRLNRKVRQALASSGGLPADIPAVTTAPSADLTNEAVLTAGTGISVTVGAGTVTVANTQDPAPKDASYVTLGTNGTLTNERVLTAGAGVTLTDAGAGSTVTVASNDIVAYKSADQTLIGAALADVTDTGLSLQANVTYQFEFYLLCDADAATTGIDVTCNGPATSILQYEMIYWTSTTATAVRGSNAYNTNNASTASNGATVRGYWVRGVIRPSAAGTLIARIKREAVGTGPNVRAGSYGRARRLS